MARPRSGAEAARTVGGRRIGFIGKLSVTAEEATLLRYIGRCIARLGHTLVIVPTNGTQTWVREGVEVEQGSVETLESGVIDSADRTLLYADPSLYEQAKNLYPDLDTKENVAIIWQDEVVDWYHTMKAILRDKGIPAPR